MSSLDGEVEGEEEDMMGIDRGGSVGKEGSLCVLREMVVRWW